MLPPADYHADASPLVQMLRKGHRNVHLDAEGWDRLVTWMDMNAPAYGTWLEIPTASGNETVRRCRDRRNEALRYCAGRDEDPEAVIGEPRGPIVPLMPPSEPPADIVRVAGWPFSAEEAQRRQTAASGPAQIDIDLAPRVKMHFVRIPAGRFVMGDRTGYPDERPLTTTEIKRSFWMGKVEVTNEQYACFDPTHQSGHEGTLWLKWSKDYFLSLDQPRQPVCRVSWNDAEAFCRWLSEKTGGKCRLPTEAEWEWACRAGTETALSYGPVGADSAPFANLADRSLLGLSLSNRERVGAFMAVDAVDDKHTVSAPVGSFQANAWGLCDMHGNVAEWTASTYLPYPFREDDPRHAARDARKSVRGGSWYSRADLARSGCRISYWPWQRVFDVGFRVLCEAAPVPR